MKNNKAFMDAHVKALSGKGNPQYGKFGEEHPAYGHKTKPEVRELRRQARLNHISARGKRTDIEGILSDMLDWLDVSHASQKMMYGKFVVDEFLPEFNLVIEAFGSYWHGDTRVFPELSKMQASNTLRDKSKLKYLTTCGHRVLILWEFDLKNNPKWCIDEIKLAIENSFIPFVQDSIQ